MTPALRDLLTILYRPRETMRRILDSGNNRWTIQITLLAAICASVNDHDIYRLREIFPGLHLAPALATIALGIIGVACVWVVLLFIYGWIVTFVGRLLNGAATAADVRAALSWGLVPAIWSVLYRIPFAVYAVRFHTGPRLNAREILFNYAASGGCALFVVYIAFQLIVFVWSLFIATNTLSETQRFSAERAFANLAIAVFLPLLVIIPAVFAVRQL